MEGDRAFVLNGDAAIRLDHLGYLQPLARSAAVVIAPAVAGRLLNEQRGRPDLRWVRIVTPDPEQVGRAGAASRADRSEMETVALALQLGATAVIDSDASSLARRAGAAVSNSISVLTGIHGLGLGQRSIEQDLQLLESTGARIDGWTRELTQETVRSLQVLQGSKSGFVIDI